MKPDENLVSHATSAHRARDAEGRLLPDPAWMDLDADGRGAAFEATVRLRRMEAAIDPQGLTSTAYAVLARLSR